MSKKYLLQRVKKFNQELRSMPLFKKSKEPDVKLFKNNIRLLVLLICLKISELLITIIALPLGAIEANLIVQILLNNPMFMLLYFIFLSVGYIFFIHFFYKYKMYVASKILLVILLMSNIFFFYVIINNLFVLYRLVI